ncbi:MAG TPA: hypothetical protein EYQ31_14105, partial [Candidatus Handelsmanbacteria bacterium]|nr:hypothetical protein [Candidatus Handelsmanbacteria bacterium]
MAGYYAHISALDECLGRLLDGLVERGLDQDTIVVFTSDQGLRIRTSVTDGPWLLYDNTKDPDHLRNLVDEPAAAAVRASLDAELEGWLFGGPLSGRCLLCR